MKKRSVFGVPRRYASGHLASPTWQCSTRKIRLIRPIGPVILLSTLYFLLSTLPSSAQIFSDVDFRGNVKTSAWSAVSILSVGTTTNGYYTSGTRTNYYRLSGTNLAGRIPLSTNIIFTFAGNTNGTTNAVTLTWTRKPGVAMHIIEKSYDLGVNWTNWLTAGPTVTNWTDTGSNTWTATIFTNVYSAIPAQTFPWYTKPECDAAFAPVAEPLSLHLNGDNALTGDLNMGNHTQLIFYADSTNYVQQWADAIGVYWLRMSNGVLNVITNSLYP